MTVSAIGIELKFFFLFKYFDTMGSRREALPKSKFNKNL